VASSIRKDHADRQREQHHLRDAIAYWVAQYPTHSDSVNYKRFYHTFGIDVVSAKALSSKDAIALRERVQSKTKTNLPALPPLPSL
jgi:hypothetical protein